MSPRPAADSTLSSETIHFLLVEGRDKDIDYLVSPNDGEADAVGTP
jgi:hypothetical protein